MQNLRREQLVFSKKTKCPALSLVEGRDYMDGGSTEFICTALPTNSTISVRLVQIMDLTIREPLWVPGALYFNNEIVPVRGILEKSILEELTQIKLTEEQKKPMEEWHYNAVKKSAFGVDLNLFWARNKSMDQSSIDELIAFVKSDRYAQIQSTFY